MKSISEIAAGVVQTMTIAADTNLPALAPRLAPLDPTDIKKIDQAIARSFDVVREPIFGNVPRKDANGEIYGYEFDRIGDRETFTPRGNLASDRLRETILRPTTQRNTVFHLTRLAIHRRDTRGAEAFGIAVGEIAADLRDVSEWAVVTACREMRQREGWYPSAPEIVKTIREADARLRRHFGQTGGTPPALTADPPPPSRRDWKDTPKPQWDAAHWADYIADAFGMAAQAKANPGLLDLEFWVMETARRRNESAIAGFMQVELQDGEAA